MFGNGKTRQQKVRAEARKRRRHLVPVLAGIGSRTLCGRDSNEVESYLTSSNGVFGEDTYEGRELCSDACERAYIAYLNAECRG